MSEKIKYGLALGSGGGRGLVHIGVLKGLEERGIEISAVSGSSIGSLIGAMYALGYSAKKIECMLLDDKWGVLNLFIDPGIIGGIISGDKLSKQIKKWFDDADFSDLKIPFAAVACDLHSGDPVIMSDGDLISSVRASMAVPGLFKPIVRDDLKLVDGGVVMPVPAEVVKKMDVDKVIAVNLDYRKVAEDKDANYAFATNVTLRSINIMRHYLAEYSLKNVDFVLNPKIEDAGIVGMKSYFDKKRAQKLIEMGRRLVLDLEI